MAGEQRPDDAPLFPDALAPAWLVARRPTFGARRHLVPAALRTWRRMAADMGLSAEEALSALGRPAAGDVARWEVAASPGDTADVPVALIERLSHLLNAWALSVRLFGGPANPALTALWWASHNTGDLFAGRAPRELVAGGDPLELWHLRCWLEGSAG